MSETPRMKRQRMDVKERHRSGGGGGDLGVTVENVFLLCNPDLGKAFDQCLC